MKCLGGCGKTVRSSKAPNWKIFQMCYPCALENHPEFYEGKQRHGTGGKYLQPAQCIPMTTPKINT